MARRVVKDSGWGVADRLALPAHPEKQCEAEHAWRRTVALFATAKTPRGDVAVGVTHLLSLPPGLSEIVSTRMALDLSKWGQ